MISETRSYNLSTSSLLKLTNNLTKTKTKMELGIGFNGAGPITSWNCLHFRHPTDEQLIYSAIFMDVNCCLCRSKTWKVKFHLSRVSISALENGPTLTLFSICCFSMALKVWFFAATSDCLSICSSCSLPICPWSLAMDSSHSRSSRPVSCCCFRACSRSFFSFLISTSFCVILPEHSSV